MSDIYDINKITATNEQNMASVRINPKNIERKFANTCNNA